MKVYKINVDSNNVQNLSTKDTSFFQEKRWLDFTGKSLKNEWPGVSLYNMTPKIKSKDFYNFKNNVLIFTEDVNNLLQTAIANNGEYLEINFEKNEKLFLFNITKICSCIDKSKSLYDVHRMKDNGRGEFLKLKGKESFELYENEKIYLKKPSFIKEKVNESLFMVIDNRGYGHGPFCTHGFFDRKAEFYQIYIDNNLQGLTFQEVELT